MKVIVAALFGIFCSFSSFAWADQWTAPAEWAYHQYGEGMIYIFGPCTVWASLQGDQSSLKEGQIVIVASSVKGDGAGGTLQVSRIFRDENGVPRLKREPPSEEQTTDSDAFYATCGSKLENLPLQVKKMFAGYYGLQ